MDIEEDLNPPTRAKYDELMGIYNQKLSALMTELNIVLKQNGLSSISTNRIFALLSKFYKNRRYYQ